MDCRISEAESVHVAEVCVNQGYSGKDIQQSLPVAPDGSRESGAGGSEEIFGLVGCLQSCKVIDARSKQVAGPQEEKVQC
jgi:hypothetical protein